MHQQSAHWHCWLLSSPSFLRWTWLWMTLKFISEASPDTVYHFSLGCEWLSNSYQKHRLTLTTSTRRVVNDSQIHIRSILNYYKKLKQELWMTLKFISEASVANMRPFLCGLWMTLKFISEASVYPVGRWLNKLWMTLKFISEASDNSYWIENLMHSDKYRDKKLLIIKNPTSWWDFCFIIIIIIS